MPRKKSEWRLKVLRVRGENKGKPYTRVFKTEREMLDCIERYKGRDKKGK